MKPDWSPPSHAILKGIKGMATEVLEARVCEGEAILTGAKHLDCGLPAMGVWLMHSLFLEELEGRRP